MHTTTLRPENNHAAPGLVSCAALIAVRNEARYLPALLSGLLDQGIDVFILDHDSSDGSHDSIQSFAHRGRIRTEHLPWTGSYDLDAVLKAKQTIVDGLSHDWIISIDADEWLQSPRPGERLREGITRVDRQGYNAINFEEFVFLPIGRDNDTNYDFRRENLNYYYFAPFPQRLMRAWRNHAGFKNLASGGHKLEGPGLNLAPENFILRHYIGLSQQHIIDKYVGRPYAGHNLERGWHGNRVGLTADQLQFPPAGKLKRLEHASDKQFDRSRPQKKHYWNWGFWRLRRLFRAFKA